MDQKLYELELKHGLCDSPEDEDSLGMEDKCKGIAEFISKCSTPMTMAIQGDWGTGKSTALRLIEHSLTNSQNNNSEVQNENICIINFNTWQFSVLNDGDKLILDLLNFLYTKLEEWIKAKGLSGDEAITAASSKVQIIMRMAGAFVGNAARTSLYVLKEFVDDSDLKKWFNGLVKGFIKKGKGKQNEPEIDIQQLLNTKVAVAEDLKDSIQKLIKAITDKLPGGDGRIYVMIDDLDRLEPAVAVELLEGMKNFVDCEHCVFILAVDQDVVERGLRKKYGDDFSSEKAGQFFDKIIQVPFVLPIDSYDIKGYISKFFKTSGNSGGNETGREEEIKKYEALLNAFNEKNPRAIKRSFNSLMLNECIENARGGEDSKPMNNEDRLKLYAVLLLQLEARADYKLINSMIADDHGDIGTVDLKGFKAKIDRFLYPEDHDSASSKREKYLSKVLEQFGIAERGELTEAQKEGIQQFIKYMTHTNETMSNRETSPVKLRVWAIQDIYKTLAKNDKLSFEFLSFNGKEGPKLEGTDPLFETAPDVLSDSGVCMKADMEGCLRFKLTWLGKENGLNISVYLSAEETKETALNGIGDSFFVKKVPSDKQPGKLGYYFNINRDKISRLTVTEVTSYPGSGILDKLFENIGLI